MDSASLLRAMHVLGAVLLLGNVIVTGLWAALLWRARPAVPFRPVARAIMWADLCFTVLGGSALTVSGIFLIQVHRLPWRELAWVRHGIGALAAGTLIWLVVLLPDQLRMDRLPEDDPRYARAYWRWTIVGWGATLILLYGLWAMVTKS